MTQGRSGKARPWPELTTRWQHSPTPQSLGPRVGLVAKATRRAVGGVCVRMGGGGGGRSVITEGRALPSVSSGPEVGLEPRQAAPYLRRQANLELLVGRPGAGDKTLATGLPFQELRPTGQGVCLSQKVLANPSWHICLERLHRFSAPQNVTGTSEPTASISSSRGAPSGVGALTMSLLGKSLCHLEHSAILVSAPCYANFP